MLVLSRKRGEAIAIESDIQIEILEISKGRVRLGIRAPRTRKIIRSEVLDRERAGRASEPVGGDGYDLIATLPAAAVTPA